MPYAREEAVLADRRGDRLGDQMDLARAGAVGSIAQRLLLDGRRAGRHAGGEARP